MDLLAFSHLRWDFVYQRPQHLLSRFAKSHRVYFWEEPKYLPIAAATLNLNGRNDLLTVVVPELPVGTSDKESLKIQKQLLQGFMVEHGIQTYTSWYYTPMARYFTRDLKPAVIVYDCMDELSAFRGAPPGLTRAEAELFRVADLVFTGGQSLYESKKSRHPSVHLFPSSIDAQHFRAARSEKSGSTDQQSIPRPRLGYCGVIDERMDLELLTGAADIRPDWHFVMVGPVVKISEADLPRRPNIHYLGGKTYAELPSYMAEWDIGILPFARNESTRYISPTKTPEYLAAGLPVVSTSITDVIRPYGEAGLVEIADTPAEFVRAAHTLLARNDIERGQFLRHVDTFLASSSWDRTFSAMRQLILDVARNSAVDGSATTRAIPMPQQITGTSQQDTIDQRALDV